MSGALAYQSHCPTGNELVNKYIEYKEPGPATNKVAPPFVSTVIFPDALLLSVNCHPALNVVASGSTIVAEPAPLEIT